MRKSRYSDEQIAAALRQAEAVGRPDARRPWALRRGIPVPDRFQVYDDYGSQRHLDQRRERAQRVLGGRQLSDVRNGLLLLW